VDIIYRFDPDTPFVREQPPDAHSARRALEEGNRRFSQLVESVGNRVADADRVPTIIPCDPRLLGRGPNGEAPAQEPFVALLGCSDARVPPQMIFQRMSNEMFVVRVAGHVLGDEVVGSLEYAVHHLAGSVRLVVVLGHSGCGAVTAAVDVYLKPMRFGEIGFTQSVRSMVYRLLLPVRGAAGLLERGWGPDVATRPGYRRALVETAVCVNAAETAFQLGRQIAAHGESAVEVVFGVYDLVTQRVGLLAAEGDTQSACLTPAPQGPDDFTRLAESIVRSAPLREALGEPTGRLWT
jgi:carbonic anhydrase